MYATALKTNYMKSPCGIDGGRVVFSWTPVDGVTQTAFSVAVYTDEGTIFDSGRVESARMEYEAPADMPWGQRIRWSVTL